MRETAVKRLYLMQVGSMPEYQIPITCYLVQTQEGENILIDSGLPVDIPQAQADFVNGQMVIEQLARIGLQPEAIDLVVSTHYDFDHAGNHAAFTKARYVVQRAHHEHAPTNERFALIRAQWDQPLERIRLVDGDTELLPGFTLIETSGHVVGNQSVLLHLPKTGAVLLTVDAVPFADGFVRAPLDAATDPGPAPDSAREAATEAAPDSATEAAREADPDAEARAIRASTDKLLDLAEREQAALVIFGHDAEQWQGLKQLPEYYE